MDKPDQVHTCNRNFVCLCPSINQSMKRMSAELMIKSGIIEELQAELNEKHQRLVRFTIHNHQPPYGGIFMP